MRKIFSIFLLLLGLTVSDIEDNESKKCTCAGRAETIENEDCSSKCLTPSDACQDCVLSKIPEECKSLPSWECYKCAKLQTETYPGCRNAVDIPKCMGDIIKAIEPTCERCVCTLACPLQGPGSKSCKQCRDKNDDVDHSEYYLHSHSKALAVCTQGWTASKDSCFKAFDDELVPFGESYTECGDMGYTSLAVLDTNDKRSAAIDAVSQVSKQNFWVAATCDSKGICYWDGTKTEVQGNFQGGCPQKLFPLSGLKMNKKGKWCDLPINMDTKQGYICEQIQCSPCANGYCCHPTPFCSNGNCSGDEGPIFG